MTKHTAQWMRCRLTFSLIRSVIMCIRGSRKSFTTTTPWKALDTGTIDLATQESLYPFPGQSHTIWNLEQSHHFSLHLSPTHQISLMLSPPPMKWLWLGRDGRGSMAVHKLTMDFMPCCCLDGSMCGL